MDKKTIYTIGTSNRSLIDFLEILHSFGIKCVIDVRRFPTSRFAHFKKNNLSVKLEQAGFSYVYYGDRLGGFRDGGYKSHMKTDVFLEALGDIERLAGKEPTVLLCAEKLPWRCHRRFIGAALEEREWEVIHILEKGKTWQPEEQLDLLGS